MLGEPPSRKISAPPSASDVAMDTALGTLLDARSTHATAWELRLLSFCRRFTEMMGEGSEP